MKWISVKDEMPKDHVSVLCITDEGYMFVNSYNSMNGWNSDGGLGYYIHTHWMKLPKPPKDQE